VVGVFRDPSPSYGLVPRSGSCLYVLRFMSTFTIPVFLFSPECVAKGRLISDLLFGWGKLAGHFRVQMREDGFLGDAVVILIRRSCAQSLQSTLTTH
jgi:hypothetical protein